MRSDFSMASTPALRAGRPRVAAVSRTTSTYRRRQLRRGLGRVGTHVALLAIAAFALAPLAWAISSAFKSDTEIMTNLSLVPAHPTLDHFKVPEKEKGEVLALVSSLKPQIVQASAASSPSH